MLKLIIADDEKWVRTTIKSIIPFDKLNLALSCEASNGIEALELCRQYEPDILLTDIMMPGLTGLELMKEVRKLLPNLRIVVISGYNDFEYAKTAMKYGIADYLLKPIDEKELTQVLERIGIELGEQKRIKKVKEVEEEQYKKALPVICEAFLNQVISNNNMTADNIRSELHKYGIEFPKNDYTLCITAPDTNLKTEEGRVAQQYYKTIVKRTMKRYTKAVSFPLEKDKTVLVSIINNNDVNVSGIKNAFRIMNLLLKKKYSLSISSGISGSTHQLCMLQDLYLNAAEALETRFWTGAGTLAFYKSGCLSDDLKLSLTEEMLNKITLNLKLSNIQTAISYVESISNSLVSDDAQKIGYHIRPTLIKEFFWQLIQSVIIMLNIQLPFIRHESVVTGEQPYDKIRGTLFIHSLIDCIKDLLEDIFNFYHDKNPLDVNLIENAKKIIESNFAGDISLEQVARHVHLSPAYLSELFKKETGMSFIDYKTIIRIEYAKKLLCTPSINISEVSGKVGFSDPKYFSKLFKKITGKTIYEYKKEIH